MSISRYVINPKHRVLNPTAQASVWRITEWAEVKLCVEAAISQWMCSKGSLWNSSVQVGDPGARLGEDTQGDLWIGKFVCDHNKEWHGYPVRPRGSDIPPTAVIEAWTAQNRISLPVARRIHQGKY